MIDAPEKYLTRAKGAAISRLRLVHDGADYWQRIATPPSPPETSTSTNGSRMNVQMEFQATKAIEAQE
jgi:hypothetical protein